MFARLREDEETLVLWTDFLEREALTQGDPETFLVTPHYEEWPLVLIRLARVDERGGWRLLIESWRERAPSASARPTTRVGPARAGSITVLIARRVSRGNGTNALTRPSKRPDARSAPPGHPARDPTHDRARTTGSRRPAATRAGASAPANW